MKKSVLVLSSLLSIFLISCTSTKKSYPVFEDNTFVVNEIALSTSILQEGDEKIPDIIRKLPFDSISQFVTMNTGYNLDFGLISDEAIDNYHLEKNIKTEKKFAKKMLNYFVDDKNSFVVTVDYQLDPILIEDETLEGEDKVEELAEVLSEELTAALEVNETTENTEAPETESTEEVAATEEDVIASEVEEDSEDDIRDDEAEEEEPVLNYFYPTRNVARISFVQDYETGKLAVIVTLRTITHEDKATFKCKLATEISDWTYTQTFTSPETSALVYFDKDIKPIAINNESFAIYKRHNSAPSDGYYYIPTDEELTFVCTIIDDGNAFFDAEELNNITFTYTFKPNTKYRVTFKVKRHLISSDRNVSFKVDEKNLLTESIENAETETPEITVEEEVPAVEETVAEEVENVEETESITETTEEVAVENTESETEN